MEHATAFVLEQAAAFELWVRLVYIVTLAGDALFAAVLGSAVGVASAIVKLVTA